MLESRLDPFVRRHEKLKGPKGLSQKVRDIRSHSQPGFSKTMHATAWNHTRLICFHPSFWRNSLLLAHVVTTTTTTTTTTVPCHQWREFPWYQATSDCCWQTSEQKECGSYHGFWWVLKDPLKGLVSSETFTTSFIPYGSICFNCSCQPFRTTNSWIATFIQHCPNTFIIPNVNHTQSRSNNLVIHGWQCYCHEAVLGVCLSDSLNGICKDPIDNGSSKSRSCWKRVIMWYAPSWSKQTSSFSAPITLSVVSIAFEGSVAMSFPNWRLLLAFAWGISSTNVPHCLQKKRAVNLLLPRLSKSWCLHVFGFSGKHAHALS